jgi:hypothetical protein
VRNEHVAKPQVVDGSQAGIIGVDVFAQSADDLLVVHGL